MKTVKDKNGKIGRVSNEEGIRLVKAGLAEFIPKKFWKEQIRDKK